MQKSKTKNLNREHIEKFQKAQRLQQTGHLNEAEKTYQEILTDIPNNPAVSYTHLTLPTKA